MRSDVDRRRARAASSSPGRAASAPRAAGSTRAAATASSELHPRPHVPPWRMVAANRETISLSSSSVVVKGGAKRVWSPAISVARRLRRQDDSPRSQRRSSMRRRDAELGGGTSRPSRGSTYSTPSRKPWPRTSRTIGIPSSASASYPAARCPARATRSTALAAQHIEHREPDGAGERRPVPRVAQREPARPLAIASYTWSAHSTAPIAA